MDQLIFEQTERMNEFFSPILAVLENALREIVQFVYPAIAENVDYTSLTPAFCALLVLAVFLILLRILFALFRHRSRSVYVVGCLLALFVFLPGSINNAYTLWHDENAYQQAHQYLSKGQYAEAMKQFFEAGEYRDAIDEALALRDTVYQQAVEQEENGNLEEARKHFLSLNGYQDSAERAAYISARMLQESGDSLGAIQAFDSLGAYEGASQQAASIRNSIYQSAIALQENGNLEEARDLFLSLDGYRDSVEKAAYISAEILLGYGDYEGALHAFNELGTYGDSETRASSVKNDLIENWAELSEKVKEYSLQRATGYTLYFTAAMAPNDNHTQINEILCSMGIKSCNKQYNLDYPFVDVYEIVYPEHFQICSTAEETLSFISSCADAGITDFSVYFTSDYASFLFSDDKNELDRLLACSRLRRPSKRSFPSNGAISFTNAEYYPTAAGMSGTAFSLDDFQKLLAVHSSALEDEFEIMVSEEVREQLFTSIMLKASERNTLSSMLYYYGIINYTSWSPGHFLRLAPVYIEGAKILYAYNNNRTDLLNEREAETLRAALAIVALTAGNDLEREKQIHDFLCSHVIYYTDEIENNDDDCAIGAILNGAANCDGYSDAFYLCGNLAGLQVLQMPGDALKENEDNPAHIWNLIRIDGNWVVLDVTWDDDNENGVSYYACYNIGLDNASLLYVWDTAAVPVQICPNTSNALRNSELAINYADDWDQVYSILRNNSNNRNGRIEISHPSTLDLFSDRDRLGYLVYSVGVKDYLWSFHGNLMDILVKEYHDNFAICDTYNDVVQYLTSCKERGLSVFRFYCSTEDLYRQIRGYEENSPAFGSLIRSVGLNVSESSHSDNSRMFAGKISSH